MQYMDWFLYRYGLAGILLAAAFLTLFALQVWRHVWMCRRICRSGKALHGNPEAPAAPAPAVSVIVPLFISDTAFLEEGLMRLLAQEYEDYEVVVVYVGLDDDFYDELMRMRMSFPNLRTTKIEARPRYPISPKMALNIGIKSARNPYIITTTADASPMSGRWLSLMARGFVQGDNVIGYCGIERCGGFVNRMLRTQRMMSSAEWLASAASRKPYRGNRCNMGFSKKLYFDVNGFGYLNMNAGEDDLFMQRIMTPDNTSVVISPDASVAEKLHGGLYSWLRRQRLEAATQRLYPCEARGSMRVEPWSRMLFFLSAAIIFIVMPWDYSLAALALVAVRCAVVTFAAARIAARTGERGITATYLLYDLLSPVADLAVRMATLRKNPSIWRYTSIS